jgi:hypothetical protein
MKIFRIFATVVLAGIAVLSSPAQAQSTATSTFNVNLTLTPKCYINFTTGNPPTDGSTTDVALAYTAFQTVPAQASTSFTVRCTNTFPYSIAVTNDTETIDGITYFVALAAGSTPSYASASGSATIGSQTGNGSDKTYSIGIQAAADQAGTCAATPCTGSKQHTVTVTY